jgi:tight adherence protein B
MDPAISAALLFAGAILLIAAGAMTQVAQRSREVRLAHFIGRFRTGTALLEAEEEANRERSPLVQRLNRALSHQDFVNRMRLDLVRAGITVKPTQFFLLRLGLALCGLVLAYSFSASLPFILRFVAMIVATIVGYWLVRPYLAFRQRRRIAAFEKPFPDALDIMVGSLESGGSMSTALAMVSREMPAPLSTEFDRLLRDTGLGLSYEEGFNGVLERVPSEDLSMLVSAVSIQFRVGGNLAEVLKTLSHTVRDRVRIRGEIKTLTSQQAISAKIITGLPFALGGFLFIINGAYMRHLFDPGLPRLLVVVALIMIAIGNWVIRKIVTIDV